MKTICVSDLFTKLSFMPLKEYYERLVLKKLCWLYDDDNSNIPWANKESCQSESG